MMRKPTRPSVASLIGSASSLHDRPDQPVDDPEDHRDDDQAGDLAVVGEHGGQQRDEDVERDGRHDRADDEASHDASSWAGDGSVFAEDSRSAQQESASEGIAFVEGEGVLAGLEGRAFDLGDDRWASVDRRTCLDHAAVEDRIDDRSMAERLADADLAAVVEDRQPGRRSGAARRSIDLAVGEDRDVALGQRLVADGSQKMTP